MATNNINQRKKRQQVVSQSRFKVRYIFYIALALMLILSIVSYSGDDYSAIIGGSDTPPENWIGTLGASISHWLFLCCGLSSYIFLVLLGFAVLRAFLTGKHSRFRFILGSGMVMLGSMLLFAIAPETFASITELHGLGRSEVPAQGLSGGVIGYILAGPKIEEPPLAEGLIRQLIGPIGTTVTGWTLLFAGVIMIYIADFHQFVVAHIALNIAERPARHDDENEEEYYEEEPPPVVKPTRSPKANSPQAKLRERIQSMDDEDEAEASVPKPKNSSSILGNAMSALQALKGKSHVDTSLPEEEGEEDEVVANVVVEEPEIPMRPEAPPEAIRSSLTAHTQHGEDVNTAITEHGKKASKSLLGGYTLPPLTMLSKGTESYGGDLESILHCKDTLQRTLDSFNVSGSVVGYISGPRVTRYEIQLAPGVSVKKVENLESNIAMELEAKSVRILAPIPGKPLVGVEAPNATAEAVFMRSIMESDEWQHSKMGIPIVLGKNVAGKSVMLDLAKAPHLLIAGSTGSGKSVCMNTLIMSMVFRFRPDELRLILVDPKIVEFEDYRTLPHLITPVINDAQKVPLALRWAVSEMERRYRVLAKAGVKNLAGFNSRTIPPEPQLDHDGLPIPDTMPVLVVIVDELADLMMTEAKKDVETSIARIAQKGRAAGIHIVIATQRPSREIITGVIRANLPTKIAFMVGKRIDSQVILDQNGAESLLGKGDMLFLPPGVAALERIQGAMVDDDDIKSVVKFVSAQAEQEFNSAVTAEAREDDDDDPEEAGFFSTKGSYADDDDDDDDAYSDIEPIIRKYLRAGDHANVRKALEIIIMERKASTSYLQRRLGIGYNKAAELIDLFEERGVIGPQTTGGGKREVLIFDDIVGQ